MQTNGFNRLPRPLAAVSRPAAARPTRRCWCSKKLDKSFDATHALKAVDLSFERGEIHAIVGENGAGKSTLIKLLTGVHPRSSGEVIWEGQPVALSPPRMRRSRSASMRCIRKWCCARI